MRLRFLIATAALLVSAGCGSSTTTTTTHTVVTSSNNAPAGSTGEWVGTWRTTFGEMRISADGSKVTGTYDYCGGTLSGAIEDQTYSGTWQEQPDAPGCRRGAALPHTGTFQFALNPQGKSFSGTWKYSDGSVDKNMPDWNGVRLSP